MWRVSILFKINQEDFDDDELLDRLFKHETCILSIADREGETLEAIGKIVNLTRERIRQIEAKGLRTMRHKTRKDVLREVA